MPTKTIAITEEAYSRLVALKAPEESFSKEVLRLTTTCGSIMNLAGAWKDLPEKEVETMKARIVAGRKERERPNAVNFF